MIYLFDLILFIIIALLAWIVFALLVDGLSGNFCLFHKKGD